MSRFWEKLTAQEGSGWLKSDDVKVGGGFCLAIWPQVFPNSLGFELAFKIPRSENLGIAILNRCGRTALSG